MIRVRTIGMVASVLGGALALAGCGQKFEDRAVVDRLRILAVRAEPPEAAPGAIVTVDALVADPEGAGRAVAREWALCTPDPVKGVASCTEPGRTQPIGVGDSVPVTLPAGALDGLTPDEQEKGVDLFVVLQVAAGSDLDASFKRVRVSTSSAPNRNPVLVGFAVDGDFADLVSARADAEADFAAVATDESRESYVGPSGPTFEELRFDWLVTAGTPADAITFGDGTPVARTRWTPDGSAATAWLVVRDPRGGVAWDTKLISLQ